jgi:hypothetical protein
MLPDARYLRPDADRLDAAWGLFLVHLDEAVERRGPETELVLARRRSLGARRRHADPTCSEV